ncbi:MAG: DnaJ C-terminal domain-containing protein [Saccharospirillum sp.]
MEFKDYYSILGVASNASQDDIKKAYRRLARKFHPDVSKEQDAEARFKDVGEAYEVLGDAGKRAEYDQIRALGAAGGRRGATGRGTGEEEMARQFSDFFESIFGGMGAGSAQADPFRSPRNGGWSGGFRQRGRDQQHKLALFLEEAKTGVQRQIKLRSPEADAFGQPRGRSRTLNVKIPAGVIAGQRIRLAGQGGPGVGGGEPGDLFLEIELAPHPVFEADGKNLRLTLPITPWEAALGSKVTAPTLEGPVTLTIPKGSTSGRQLRLKGKGLGKAPAGDLLVTLQVTVPTHHSDTAEALYRQLAQVEKDFNPRQRLEAQAG